MLRFGVFSRTNLVDTGRPTSLNPRPVNLLQPLLLLPKSQLLYNQAYPASFCKTPGVGVPQHLRVTLRFCRHMHHVAPLSPVASFDCAYFPSPQGCTERSPKSRHSSLITRHFPFVFIHLQSLYSSLHSFSGSHPLFSTTCRLFCQNTPGCGGSSLAFKRADALFHPHVSTGRPDRPSDLQTGGYDQGREM